MFWIVPFGRVGAKDLLLATSGALLMAQIACVGSVNAFAGNGGEGKVY